MSEFYPFTIWFEASGDDDETVERLYGGALDDSVISGSEGQFQADFERSADSFPMAIVSAIKDIESEGCRVLRVGREDLVSLAEIGRRLGRSRESIRLLAKGDRGPGGFPSQVPYITGQDLWSWQQVAGWFVAAGEVPPSARIEAAFLRLLNASIEQRNVSADLGDDESLALVAAALSA